MYVYAYAQGTYLCMDIVGTYIHATKLKCQDTQITGYVIMCVCVRVCMMVGVIVALVHVCVHVFALYVHAHTCTSDIMYV